MTFRSQVVVSDCNNVQVFYSDGRLLFQFGTNESQFQYPQGVGTDQHNNIIVCDRDNNRVQIFTRCGQFVSCTGTGTGRWEFAFCRTEESRSVKLATTEYKSFENRHLNEDVVYLNFLTCDHIFAPLLKEVCHRQGKGAGSIQT